ncbi:MAG: PEP-CTERM sorting domain-containing protein [Planctomycetota bacterium]|nr:MAG: PEP-CTERM sorting domain-containing protein [Planctomycetota bacterium]
MVVNGSGTGATITDNVLDLYPNYNTYANSLNGTNADRAFWTNSSNGGVTPGPRGNKWMEANTYVESTVATDTAVFSGTVSAYSLASEFRAQAFIKLFDSNYNLVGTQSQPLTGQGNFSLSLDTFFYQGYRVQSGFMVSGTNANPAAALANGSLQVITQPSGGSVILINVGSGTTRTQAQAGYPSIPSAIVVTKTGSGTVVFDAANPYTGPTNINGGTLRVSNTAGLTASPVTINDGGTLAIAAANPTNLASVTVDVGGAMTLRSDVAQSVSLQSLAIKSVVQLTVDSGTMTNGFMNVSDLPSAGGAFQFGSQWAVPDLRADFTSGTSVTLAPCFVTDTSSFWYTPSGQPGATGNKIMEANVYGQADGTLAGKTVKFSGTVPSYSLLSGSGNWTVNAFVRDFSADYSSVTQSVVPISGTGAFSVSLATSSDPTRHVQWGLQTTGPDVWVTDLPSKGNVVVNALPVAAEGGKVDVGRGFVTVASGLTPVELVTAIVAGRADGSWTGATGITSTAAAAAVAVSTPRAVGWLDNGDGSVSFAYAAPGDTNIDWQVDVLDASNFLSFGKFDTGFAADWLEGDFNYDGVVDVLDAADFFGTGLYDAGNYNTGAGSAGSVAAVPEPSSLAFMAIGAGLLVARGVRRWSCSCAG